MFKKIFACVLVYAFISVLFGQDLNYQINSLNEKYDTNIQENIETSISNALESFFNNFIE